MRSGAGQRSGLLIHIQDLTSIQSNTSCLWPADI